MEKDLAKGKEEACELDSFIKYVDIEPDGTFSRPLVVDSYDSTSDDNSDVDKEIEEEITNAEVHVEKRRRARAPSSREKTSSTRAKKKNEQQKKRKGKRMINCNYCPRSFAGNFALYRHNRRTHEPTIEKLYFCEKCPYNTNHSQNMLNHLKAKHGIKKVYKCDVCGKTFHSYSVMVRHKLTHKQVVEFKCDMCDASYTTKPNMNKHKLLKHCNWVSEEATMDSVNGDPFTSASPAEVDGPIDVPSSSTATEVHDVLPPSKEAEVTIEAMDSVNGDPFTSASPAEVDELIDVGPATGSVVFDDVPSSSTATEIHDVLPPSKEAEVTIEAMDSVNGDPFTSASPAEVDEPIDVGPATGSVVFDDVPTEIHDGWVTYNYDILFTSSGSPEEFPEQIKAEPSPYTAPAEVEITKAAQRPRRQQYPCIVCNRVYKTSSAMCKHRRLAHNICNATATKARSPSEER
ncbi:zinc finger protein 131-like [Anopheles darlingi]|uniref:zinc finger protein 131-like n=1 Tax=Anopheles darlingi TaxID=43151 RepID=UPI00210063A3|nr:zinc finger protein 131-like [Anopheles darlingi]